MIDTFMHHPWLVPIMHRRRVHPRAHRVRRGERSRRGRPCLLMLLLKLVIVYWCWREIRRLPSLAIHSTADVDGVHVRRVVWRVCAII